MDNVNGKCPCGTGKTFNTCCLPIHNDISLAKTPEQLMRSRYSAFTIGNADYLLQSHHSSKISREEANNTASWAKKMKWMKLDVLNSKFNETEGQVEFIAHYRQGPFKKKIHEISRFVIENNHWVYLDGIHH